MKQFVKEGAKKSGIMTINKGIAADVEKLYQKYVSDALAQGVDLDTLGPEQLKMIVAMNAKATNRVISGSSAEGKAITEKLFGKKGEVVDMTGKKIDTSQGIMGGKSVKELMDSGQVQKGTDGLKKNDKILERKMFKNSNLNETDAQIKARLEAGNNKSIDSIKKKNRDSMPIRLMKNFGDELNEADLIAEGYSKDQAKVLIRARKKMTSGEEMNPNESLQRVKEEFANDAGIDVEDFTDIDFEIEIPDYAKGGRAGLYTGGMVDVEPNLSDIGHGSDALMARTRLVSPDGQATTSTGLNYLLAEDNDNIRVPFSGGGMSKRAFLKLIASLGGTAAAFKSGILGIGEGGAKKAVTETVKQAAGSGGQVPPYFLNLVKKIKTLGDDVTETGALAERQTVKRYKDYELTEDKVTGRQEITKYKVDDNSVYDGSEYYGKPLTEETYMSYTPGENIIGKGGKPVKTQPEYEEGRALLRNDRGNRGEIVEEIEGVSDDVIKEGTMFEDNLSDFGKADGGRIGFYEGGDYNRSKMKELADAFARQKYGRILTDLPDVKRFEMEDLAIKSLSKDIEKKADGGRIGFVAGGLSKLGITGSSRRFLEKVFGKEKFKTMIENDPEMHRGMLEVVEMFRKKDKSGLVDYMQKFLPQMSKKELEAFVVSSGDTAGIEGQLIRLGSGRDYKGKLDMIKEADQIRKLDDFDIEDVSKNAEGGRIGLFLGGGLTQGKSLLKNMLKFMAKDGSHKKSPAEVLQMYNPKQFNKLLNNPMNTGKISPATGETADQMIKDTMNQTKKERADMVGHIIGTSRKIKGTDDDIIAYKIKIIKDMIAGGIDEKTARSFAEQMGEQMVRAAGKKVTPKITEQGLLELENIQKNLITKDRKLQATGGLTTMLGE